MYPGQGRQGGFLQEEAFRPTLAGRLSCLKSWGEGVLGRGNSKCEDPKTGRREHLRGTEGRSAWLGGHEGGCPEARVGTSQQVGTCGLSCADWVLCEEPSDATSGLGVNWDMKWGSAGGGGRWGVAGGWPPRGSSREAPVGSR